MDLQPNIYFEVKRIIVGVSPTEGYEAYRYLYSVNVDYWSHIDSWVVTNGSSPSRYCDEDGNWEYYPHEPSEKRRKEWSDQFAFSKEKALEIAARECKLITINNNTYKDYPGIFLGVGE